MCGICAGIGKDNQIKYVVEGLKNLEYRGYDSSGVAFLKDKDFECVKAVGPIKNLEEKLHNKNMLKEDFFDATNLCIGHTRWATHGKVCEENSHPQFSQSKRFAMVHNGIIENFQILKTEMNLETVSETDTEIFVNLIERQTGDTLTKIIEASKKIIGSFAIAVLDKENENIYLARRGSPLSFSCENGRAMASSDLSILSKYFKKCWILNDDEFAVINSKNAKIFDKNGKKIKKNAIFLKNCIKFCENSEENCYMKKEIFEQPQILKTTFEKYKNSNFDFLKEFDCFHFIACGTAYHSCLLGANFFNQFLKKESLVSVASEFRYSNPILKKSCLYIFVSQSGETADTLACAKLVKQSGHKSLCISNVPFSSLEQICDFTISTLAGKEVAVASTKAFTSQVFTLLILSLQLSNLNCQKQLEKFCLNFEIKKIDNSILQAIFKYKKIFFIGRQQDYFLSLEGALKLKEIGYVNCLGISAGELKHGSLALIDEDTLVIAISTQQFLKEKIESNILEVKARGGKILLLSQMLPNIAVDYFLKLDSFEEFLMPIVAVVPLQQIALEYALNLGNNPDKPRNLAKAVTVE